MLKVYLLRHGETRWNREGNKYCGRSDIPLTEKGIRQAKRVRKQIKDLSLDAIYSSPLKRAYKTAKIAGGKQQEISQDKRLIEVDFGQWEGKPKRQFIIENRELWDSWIADPKTTQAGGTGETARQVIDRVGAFFKEALQKHSDGAILVVAHNGVNRLYMAHKLGMPLGNYRKLVQRNSTVSMFSLDREYELTLHQLNSSQRFGSGR
jgi:alpha-ribazole phosphatase/probable phosphoglycerate mutase